MAVSRRKKLKQGNDMEWGVEETIIAYFIFFLGIFCGRKMRDDANQERLESIQFIHIQELCRARKARLCDLLGLPHEVTQPGEIQGRSSISE